MQMADGISVRKGIFGRYDRERKSFKTAVYNDQVDTGRGRKLKEVNIQTHQWIRRKPAADRVNMYWIITIGNPSIKSFKLGEDIKRY